VDDSTIREMLEASRIIAVVGLSPKEDRPSYRVASYLRSQGYRIIPVNPAVSEVLGEKAYGSLEEIPPDVHVDLVDVFRRPEDVPPIAEQAVARGAKSLWLQEGIVHEEAAAKAAAAGLRVVMDRCMLREHKRLLGKGP
jgi:predicted CoA-binding protein